MHPHDAPYTRNEFDGCSVTTLGAMAKPVSVSVGLTIEGGHLADHTWDPRTLLQVDGRFFSPLTRADRELANAIGLITSVRSHWGKNAWPDCLASLRGDAVQKLMDESARTCVDPLADTGDKEKRPRRDLLADVDSIIPVHVPEVGPLGMTTLYTVKPMVPKEVFAFELTQENIECLSASVRLSCPMPRVHRDIVSERLGGDTPNVLWAASRSILWCHYVDDSGQRRTKQRKVPHHGDKALRHATMEAMAQGLQMFYNDNHHEDDWHDGHDGGDGCPAEGDDGDKDPECLPDAAACGA